MHKHLIVFFYCIIFVLLLFVLDAGHCMWYIGVPVVRVIIIIGGIWWLGWYIWYTVRLANECSVEHPACLAYWHLKYRCPYYEAYYYGLLYRLYSTTAFISHGTADQSTVKMRENSAVMLAGCSVADRAAVHHQLWDGRLQCVWQSGRPPSAVRRQAVVADRAAVHHQLWDGRL